MYKKIKKIFKKLGPGLITGASDDDPSGIATYSIAGASQGYSLLWTAFITFPLMSAIQEMCARIGVVTEKGLAGNIKTHYKSKVLLYSLGLLIIAAVTINIGADLAGMTAAFRLIIPVNELLLTIIITLIIIVLMVKFPYKFIASKLKWLTFALFAYIASALIIKQDWGQIVYSTFVPKLSLNKETITLVVAILGTTISPYLFFWQTSQEVEEGILRGEVTVRERRLDASPRTTRRMRIDVWSGMFFSNLIAFFIFAACAGTLYTSGVTNIVTADQAAAALAPFGQFALLLFALGIVGTGLLAVPILAGSSAYAIA